MKASTASASDRDVFRDPVLLTGGAGMILVAVGGMAGLIACQAENCLGTRDPTQVDTPQVKYGYPVMDVGLAIGLPLYLGAWVFAVRREDARRRLHLLDQPGSPTN